MIKILILFPILLIVGCNILTQPESDGFINNIPPEVSRDTSFYDYYKTKITFELSGHSKEVYLYYSTFDKQFRRVIRQTLPWKHSYYSTEDSAYYIYIANSYDSGKVELKISENDLLTKTRSMTGYNKTLRETAATSIHNSLIRFELTGTSKEVFLYYSTYEGNIIRSANEPLPWSHSYQSITDSLYYINVTNLNDSGYVQLKIYKDDILIKTRSMEGFEANMKETGPTK